MIDTLSLNNLNLLNDVLSCPQTLKLVSTFDVAVELKRDLGISLINCFTFDEARVPQPSFRVVDLLQDKYERNDYRERPLKVSHRDVVRAEQKAMVIKFLSAF